MNILLHLEWNDAYLLGIYCAGAVKLHPSTPWSSHCFCMEKQAFVQDHSTDCWHHWGLNSLLSTTK